jgi:hypothetical protein
MYFPLQQARVKQQVNIIDPSMGALMVAVKTELECYLVHIYVSLYTFILYNYGNPHLLVSVVELPLKKLLSEFTTKTGCSSGIKCPEFGTVIPVTF